MTTRKDILGDLVAGKITAEQADAALTALAAGGSLSHPSRLVAKVSEKGACSVYGLQRMPVTLYGSQWERLVAFLSDEKDAAGNLIPGLRSFLKANVVALADRRPAKSLEQRIANANAINPGQPQIAEGTAPVVEATKADSKGKGKKVA